MGPRTFHLTKDNPKCLYLFLFCLPVCLQLEHQCQELHSEQHETKVENVKLKQTNDELARELEHTSQELILSQEQLSVLQEQSTRLHEEKEMWVVATLTYSGFFITPALIIGPLSLLFFARWSGCNHVFFLLRTNRGSVIHSLYTIYTVNEQELNFFQWRFSCIPSTHLHSVIKTYVSNVW